MRERAGSSLASLTGLCCLLVTTLGWGLNWPATKMLVREIPPLSARGVAGLVASLALAGIALWRGEALRVPRALWPRLGRAALLNISAWMGLTSLSLVWLNAGEAAILAYTMPVWAAILAWPVLGERPTPRRVVALALGFGAVTSIVLGQNGFHVEAAKLPGFVSALSGALLFALGTVLTKRAPLGLPPVAATAWQVGLGCLPLLAIGLETETPHFATLPPVGWAALAYTAFASLGLCYLMWFAALRRLPASTAAIGTLLTPVIGVAAASLTLAEPVRLPQLAALCLVLAGVVLAVRE